MLNDAIIAGGAKFKQPTQRCSLFFVKLSGSYKSLMDGGNDSAMLAKFHSLGKKQCSLPRAVLSLRAM